MEPVIVIPGTFWKDVTSWAETYSPANRPMRAIAQIFGSVPILFDWPGTNSAKDRHAAATELANFVRKRSHRVCLLGFSHGGNIASEAAARLAAESDSPRVELLVTIATPVTGNYLTGGAQNHIHLYSPKDRMQILGGEGILGVPARAAREYPGAVNITVHGIESSDITGSHGNILWSEETWAALRRQIDRRR